MSSVVVLCQRDGEAAPAGRIIGRESFELLIEYRMLAIGIPYWTGSNCSCRYQTPYSRPKPPTLPICPEGVSACCPAVECALGEGVPVLAASPAFAALTREVSWPEAAWAGSWRAPAALPPSGVLPWLAAGSASSSGDPVARVLCFHLDVAVHEIEGKEVFPAGLRGTGIRCQGQCGNQDVKGFEGFHGVVHASFSRH